MKNMTPKPPLKRLRVRAGLLTVLFGFFLFILGAKPEFFGLDRSPVIGFVQIAVFLTGLGVICIGGYAALDGLWNSTPKTIASDIGLRLVSTGFVISVACGMADVFGFGTEIAPMVPHFGRWQMIGVLVGELVVAVGFLLLFPFRTHHTEENPNVDRISY
jgi:hypothetical protein